MFRRRRRLFGKKRSAALAALALAVVVVLPGIAGALPAGEQHRETSFTLGEVRADIGADRLHAAGITGAGVTVAVIDTGVTPVPGLDADGKVINGPDLSFEAGVPEFHSIDTYGHGTVMASIIAGNDGAEGGFRGIAPDARILSIKVADNTGSVDVTQVIAALDWLVQYGKDPALDVGVINLSYTVTNDVPAEDDPLIAAVERAWDAGFVVVVSAGNDGNKTKEVGSPARSPYVIAVGSSSEANKGLELSQYSNAGGKNRPIDLVAPGDRILGLAAPQSRLAQEHPDALIDGRFLRGGGTSQAAAVVSGSAALLLQAHPGMTPDEVKLALMLGADDRKDRARPAMASVKSTEKLSSDLAKDEDKVNKELEKLNGLLAERAELTADLQSGKASGDKAQDKLEKLAGKIDKQREKLAKAEAELNDAKVALSEALASGSFKWDVDQIDGLKIDKKIGAGWLDVGRSTWIGPTGLEQNHQRSNGGADLDDVRGESFATLPDGSVLEGNVTFTGSTWSGSTWSGSTWSGSTWSGSTWSGSTWSGSTWSGSTWSGSTWSGSTWSGSTWSGSTWSGAQWA